MIKRLKILLIGLMASSLNLAGGPSALAHTHQEPASADMFKPWRSDQDLFISGVLLKTLRKKKFAPAIVVLRPVDELSRDDIDFSRLKGQIARIQSVVLRDLSKRDFKLVHRYSFLPGFAGQISRTGLRKLIANDLVAGIDFDFQGVGHLDDSLPLIGADEWHAEGITGEGALVAVLDTGVAQHPDLDDDIALEMCILNANTVEGGIPCPDGTGQQLFEAGAASDGNGHGTNVTGIITSDGMIAPLGVAPNTEIVAIKVLDDQGPSGTGQISDWIKGLEWVLTIHPAVDGTFDVRAVNMSIGITGNGFVGNGDCEQPGTAGVLMFNAANILRQVGVLTIASSGNDSFDNGISFPACVSNIMSVGASDDTDQMMSFSNSNANLDLVAPGNWILSTGITETGILTLTGTSQASPHATACAALRIEDNPNLSPDQLQAILTNSPIFVTDPGNGLSFPRLWCKPPELM